MLEFLFQYRGDLQFWTTILVSCAMLRWGGGPERAIALVILIGMVGVDSAYHSLWDVTYQFETVDVFHATMDMIFAGSFILIALFANRMYPLWIASLQLMSATSHLVREMVEAITPIAYAVMAFAPSWGILAAMALGMWAHVRRKKKWGEYRSWRGSPPFFLERLSPRPVVDNLRQFG